MPESGVELRWRTFVLMKKNCYRFARCHRIRPDCLWLLSGLLPVSLFRLARLLPALLVLFSGAAVTAASAEPLRCRQATAVEAAFYISPSRMPGVISPRDGVCMLSDVRVTARDGVVLNANVYFPPAAASAQSAQSERGSRPPVVVMIGGWGIPDSIAYKGMQHVMAKKGFITVSYTARGFLKSGGEATVAGPDDVNDVSDVIDWTLAHTRANPEKIGVGGLSYGGGLSFLSAAQDARIRVGVSFSGWANLEEATYGQQVPNRQWVNVLLGLAAVNGRMSDEARAMSRQLRDPDAAQAQVAQTAAWAWQRSPERVVDAVNARNVPFMIVSNWQDEMFLPNANMRLFSKLTGPKKLLLRPGVHAQGEGLGLIFGLENHAVASGIMWYQRFLQGVDNGIERGDAVHLKMQNGGRHTETLSTWPAPELQTMRLSLGHRGRFRWDWGCWCVRGAKGSLLPHGAEPGSDVVYSGVETTARAEWIPIASSGLEGYGVPVQTTMSSILWNHGIRYNSRPLTQKLRIRGIPSVHLRVTPSQSRGMLVAYLYSVNRLGVGTLVTHGARAVHWATPNQEMDFSIELNATAYDVPAGNHLVLVLDTEDAIYGKPVHRGERFHMTVRAGAQVSDIRIPYRP